MSGASDSVNDVSRVVKSQTVEHIAYVYVLEEALSDYSDEAPTSI
jgi:hypothetical protein